MPTREEVSTALRATLEKMKAEGPAPDVITFAGNGEPTLHPHFSEIVDDVKSLRDDFFPDCKISVLSNATQIVRSQVFEALLKVDNNILKLDTVSPGYIRMVDKPVSDKYDVNAIVEKLMEFGSRCIIQTMFMRGKHEGRDVANTGDEFVIPWLEAVKSIKPSCVMIYTIDRETPSPLLEKATKAEMDNIAEKVRAAGIPCQVSY
jgi:wyosine [tRNA(Phe)-imidazoG37] synthetase (radical SAM superfamily)